ncbi:MAG: phosphosulfolactate synthase [Chloroflexi bacterium]|nr:phosphosulfolactate synthase [Chloroflexota bacterium]
MFEQPGCFPFLSLPQRSVKPRESGITILTDRGQPLSAVEGILEVAAEAVDMVKHNDHCGVIARFSEEWFRRKFQLYRAQGIRSMPGGIPFELAVMQGQVEPYFVRLKELGFDAVEISEDVIPALPKPRRDEIIRLALSTGLEVVTELGRKVPDRPIELDLAIAMATNDLELGVKKVTLEHSELRLLQKDDPDTLHRLVEALGLKNLVFEPNPGGWPWLHAWLVTNLGPEVNLGNVYPEELVIVEAMRRGMTRAVNYPFLTERAGKLEPSP